jgi:hypothetical protein
MSVTLINIFEVPQAMKTSSSLLGKKPATTSRPFPRTSKLHCTDSSSGSNWTTSLISTVEKGGRSAPELAS